MLSWIWEFCLNKKIHFLKTKCSKYPSFIMMRSWRCWGKSAKWCAHNFYTLLAKVYCVGKSSTKALHIGECCKHYLASSGHFLTFYGWWQPLMPLLLTMTFASWCEMLVLCLILSDYVTEICHLSSGIIPVGFEAFPFAGPLGNWSCAMAPAQSRLCNTLDVCAWWCDCCLCLYLLRWWLNALSHFCLSRSFCSPSWYSCQWWHMSNQAGDIVHPDMTHTRWYDQYIHSQHQ